MKRATCVEFLGIFQKLGLSEARSYSQGPTYLAPTKVTLSDLIDSLNALKKTIEIYFDEISTKIVSEVFKSLAFQADEVEIY